MLAFTAIAACGDDEPDRSDAGGSDVSVSLVSPRVIEPEPPAEPALPEMGACPEGWAERTGAAVRYCEPFPAGITPCTGASGLLPGSSECVRLAPACPAEETRTDIPDRGDRGAGMFVVAMFVKPGASGGDGTRARPFGTISEAIAAPAIEGEVDRTIVLAQGRYRETIAISAPPNLSPKSAPNLTILGTCAEGTVIEGGDDLVPTIAISGGIHVSLTDLSVTNPDGIAIDSSYGAWIAGRQLVLGPAQTGFAARAVDSSLVSSVVRDVAKVGVDAANGASVVLEAVAFEDAFRGIESTRARVEVMHVSILGDGYAAVTAQGGALFATQLAIADIPGGIGLDRSLATIDQLHIARTRDTALSTRDGYLLLTRSTIEDGGSTPLLVSDGPATIRDVVVRTNPDSARASEPTVAIAVDLGASLELDRAAALDTAGFAMSVTGGARIRGGDLVVADTAEEVDRICLVAEHADIDLARMRFEGCAMGGVLLTEQSDVALSDLTLTDSGESSGGPSLGIGAFGGSSLRLRRAVIERARVLGLTAHGATSSIDGSDVRVSDVLPLEPSGEYGRGFEIAGGAHARLSRVRIERVLDHGVLAVDDAELELEDIAIVDVAPRACTTPECDAHPAGIGVGVYGARATLGHFGIERASLCAAHRAADATLSLREGLVAESPVGLCVAGEAAIDEISRDVAYRDNGANLNARELPVPEAAPPVELQ